MFGIKVLTMMLLPKQFKLQSFPNAMQQPGPRAAHITRGVDILAACCAETRTQIDQKKYYCSKKQTGRKEIVFDRRNGKKEGGREGRKDDRKTACTFQFTHVTFKQLQVPQFTSVGFKNVAATLHFGDFSRNTLQTPCHYVQCADDNSTCYKYRIPVAALSFRKLHNSIQLADVCFNMLQMPCGLQVIKSYSILQAPCVVLSFAPVCCTYCASDGWFWFRHAASILQRAECLLPNAVKSQCSLQI